MQDYGYGNTYSFGIFQVDVGLNNTMEISLFSCWEEREGLLSYAIYDKGQWSYNDVDANTPYFNTTITVGDGAEIWYEYARTSEDAYAFGGFDFKEITSFASAPGAN